MSHALRRNPFSSISTRWNLFQLKLRYRRRTNSEKYLTDRYKHAIVRVTFCKLIRNGVRGVWRSW